jgi:hypothetical protein
MMSRLALVCGLVICTAVQGSAQDPTKTLPDSYKVQFENEYVRVVRVHYDAGAKLPDHEHAAGTTVYVYLNDSDGVVFRHSGRSNRAVTRPAVKTGAVRVSTGPAEHHTAENPASTPSDFLRIWLKTDGAGERTMYRLPPSEDSFDNKQLRITRLTVVEGTPADHRRAVNATSAGRQRALRSDRLDRGRQPHHHCRPWREAAPRLFDAPANVKGPGTVTRRFASIAAYSTNVCVAGTTAFPQVCGWRFACLSPPQGGLYATSVTFSACRFCSTCHQSRQ